MNLLIRSIRSLSSLAARCFALIVFSAGYSPAAEKPNIVYILADDLGYGDVQCLNPLRGKIQTPHLDKLAAQGMTFTDAHSGSSVCTPTRYGVLTGRYSWRSRQQSGVLEDNRPPLIVDGRLTVAALLKQHGYHTACIGKWHVGFSLEGVPQGRLTQNGAPVDSVTKDGPLTRGFDEFFGFDRLTEAPTSMFEGERCTRLIEPVDLLGEFVKRADSIITTRTKTGRPFFLYLPLNSIHNPIVPGKEWQGKSAVGPYGDFMMQTDAAVGEVLASLDKAGVADNTLVIFTADNGATGAPPRLKAFQHASNADLNGGKKSLFEGGHRVPFFVRWPAKVMAESQSSQLICHTDFMATCADILGTKLPDNAAEDSFSILPALLGTDKAPLHETVIHHDMAGNFAIRQGKWKLAVHGDANVLYDLSTDKGETKNLQAEHPGEVAHLTRLLEQIIADGRSTPGAKQANEVPVEVRKKAKPARKAKNQ